MGGINFGPFMFSAGHFAVLIALTLFIALTSVIGRLVDRRLTVWSSWAVAAFLIGGRVGHVIEHANNFFVEPWRAFEFWDGGLNWYAGLALIGLSSFWLLRKSSLLMWAAISVSVSASVAAVAVIMLAGLPGSAFAQGAFRTLDGKAASLDSFAGMLISTEG